MIPFLDSDNLNNEKQLDIVVSPAIKELMEWNHSNSINKEPRLYVSLCYFRQIPYFVVLVLRLELKQELDNNIHAKNDFKHNDNKEEFGGFFFIGDSEGSNVGIDVGTDDADEYNNDLPRLVH
jgi:hypothetical protein